MSSSRRKFSVRHPVVVDIGCSCRRPKLPSFFSSVSKPKPPKTPCYFSPSTTTTTTTTATTTSASHWDSSLAATNSSPSRYDYSSSPALLTPQSPRRKPKASRAQRKPTTKKENRITTTTTAAKSETKKTKTKKKAVVEESVAVVKESSDPYVDFKESMLQMIVEMEIYAWDDLRDLLHRFLALNSPYHHHLILQAFAEIWNALFSSAAVGDASTSGHRRRR